MPGETNATACSIGAPELNHRPVERSGMNNFEGAVPALVQALNDRGYTELTPVQKAVIATDLVEADALVSAQTGSGKTVAFGLAIAPTLLGGSARLSATEKPIALIVAPTRELALQVKRELDWLYREAGAVIASCVGGMDIRAERRALERGAHIVVGTPGRLRDHIMRKSLDPSRLKAVVMDEADEMLDLGFKEDLEFILEHTPEDRRTLMFSATVPPMIGKLAKQYQRDAVRITTSGEARQHVDIEYRVLVASPKERENAIINVLRYYEARNALVFCNTRATVNHMVARFNNRGFSVVALSGELSQSERTHALQAMRDERARVCIATDVAARGIDLPNLELVVHAELPSNPETLLHRSGRTGRAGRKGVSALMVDNRSRKKAERLLRFAKIDAEWASPPSADEVNLKDEERILADPILTDPLQEEEEAFVARLMDNHSPEQLATAFVRLNRMGKSAPEDLQKVSVQTPEPGAREDRSDRFKKRIAGEGKNHRDAFEKSVWISLSVGRKQNAEPRWLIPLLCNAGDITKREIGSIKMQNEETFVQLNADHGDDFFDAIGPNQTLEKNITVTRLEGVPKFGKEPHSKAGSARKTADAKYGDKKKWSGKKPPQVARRDNEESGKARRKFGPKPGDAPAKRPKTGSDEEAGSPKKDRWAKKKNKPSFKARKTRNGPPSKTGPAKPKKAKRNPDA